MIPYADVRIDSRGSAGEHLFSADVMLWAAVRFPLSFVVSLPLS